MKTMRGLSKFGSLLDGLAIGQMALGVGLPGSAQAALITSNTLTNPTTIDFSQFVAAPQSDLAGPVQVGQLVGEDVDVTGSPNTGLFLMAGGWGFLSNGSWDVGINGFVGANDARPGSLFFAFNDGPVSGVGGFMNYCPDSGCNPSTGQPADLVIFALDNAMQILEAYNITAVADISTPGAANAGGFRGIERATNDIHFFQVFGSVPGVASLSFSRIQNDIPEPASLTLFLVALGGLGFLARRRVG
ncbi:MAG: PEP-CTERM sorting domain-containing protein [Pseudomonadota bacterium]